MDEIHIEPPKNGTDGWRAWRRVPNAWHKIRQDGMSVLGGAEGYPAFVEARGGTPDKAVRALYEKLGLCYLAAEAWNAREVMLGQRADEITRLFELSLAETQVLLAAVPEQYREQGIFGKLKAWAEQAELLRTGQAP